MQRSVEAQTYIGKDFFDPSIHCGRDDESVPRIELFWGARFLIVRDGELDDCVVAEDVLFRLVDADEGEEFLLRSGNVKDSSEIEASCLVSVGWNRTPGVGLDDVIARLRAVALDSVLVLFRAVRPLADVVSVVDEVDGSILNDGEVGVMIIEVEGCKWLLESGIEHDDGVVVDSVILMIFLDDL